MKTTTTEVLGIDECDYLYSLSSRSGDSSVYTRVQEGEDGFYWAAMTVDCDHPEGDNFCEDLSCDEGPFTTPEDACAANLRYAREWFADNRLTYVYCNDTRRIARRSRRATR